MNFHFLSHKMRYIARLTWIRTKHMRTIGRLMHEWHVWRCFPKAGRLIKASFFGLTECEEAGGSPGLPKSLYTGAGLWSPELSTSPVPEAENAAAAQPLQEHWQGDVLEDPILRSLLLSGVQIFSSFVSKTGIMPSALPSFQICRLLEALYGGSQLGALTSRADVSNRLPNTLPQSFQKGLSVLYLVWKWGINSCFSESLEVGAHVETSMWGNYRHESANISTGQSSLIFYFFHKSNKVSQYLRQGQCLAFVSASLIPKVLTPDCSGCDIYWE